MTAISTSGLVQEAPIRFHVFIRWPALFFSYVFHPLFMPLFGALLLFYSHPAHFASLGGPALKSIGLSVVINTLLFPAFTVLLLKMLGFIPSIYLRSQQDRIIPYVATMIYFFWVFYAFRQRGQVPQPLVTFLLGNFIAVIAAFLSNIFVKISMHTTALGGVLGMLLCSMRTSEGNIFGIFVLMLLITGIVATSRLVLGAHRSAEIYWGLAVGLLSQLAAYWLQ